MDWLTALLTLGYLELFRRQRPRAAWWVSLLAQFLWLWLMWRARLWGFVVMQFVLIAQCVWALKGARRKGGG